MNTTENYGLKKPEKNEYISVDIINENMDMIDKSMKKQDDKKVDSSGGDTAETMVSAFEASSEEFPVPAAKEKAKTRWGKVKKFGEDFRAWMTGVCLLGHIVNNCVTNNPNLPLSAAQGKALMDLYTVLNTKLKSWDVNKYDSITDTKTGMTVVARRIRNIVLLHLSGYPSAETKADSDITVATLVTEFRPLYNLPWNTYNHQGLATATPILLRINATGEVIINFRTTPNTQQFINAVYVYPVW